MPEFDSLSFALLIPFAICFVLIFIICCFADEIKDICRMPSPLPRSYLAPEHVHRSRHNSRRRSRHARNEEARNLILSEEGRSRNVSESSTDYISASNLLANSTSNFNYLRQAGASLQQNVTVLPQSQVPNAGQRSGIPNSSATVSSALRGTFQPLSLLTNEHYSRNYNRNLTIHVSASSKDLRSCLKPKSQTDLQVHKEQPLNRNDSAPYLLNSYLCKETSDVSHLVGKKDKKDTEGDDDQSHESR